MRQKLQGHAGCCWTLFLWGEQVGGGHQGWLGNSPFPGFPVVPSCLSAAPRDGTMERAYQCSGSRAQERAHLAHKGRHGGETEEQRRCSLGGDLDLRSFPQGHLPLLVHLQLTCHPCADMSTGHLISIPRAHLFPSQQSALPGWALLHSRCWGQWTQPPHPSCLQL